MNVNKPPSHETLNNLAGSMSAVTAPSSNNSSNSLSAIDPGDKWHDTISEAAQLYGRGQINQAHEKFQFVLGQDPDNLPAAIGRGLSLIELGKLEDAKAHYDALLERWPLCWQALLGRGRVHALKDDRQAALADYKMATGLAPRSPDAHRHYAQMLRVEGHLEDALEQFNLALQGNPQCAESLAGIGHTLATAARKLAAGDDKRNPLLIASAQHFEAALKLSGSDGASIQASLNAVLTELGVPREYPVGHALA